MNNPSDKPKKNTHLIVLAAVSAFVALLLFLDPWLSIFPKSMDLPDFGSKDPVEEEGVGVIGGEETKKSWWDKIFDNGRNEPRETDLPDTPDTEEPIIFVDTDSPFIGGDDLSGEFPHYTEEGLMDMYYATLVQSFYLLAEMEAAGEILPVDKVGFFNLDGYGAPEIITMGVYNGSVEYTAYELYSMEALSSWGWEGTQYGELSLWLSPLTKSSLPYTLSAPSSFASPVVVRSLITHTGDGDDHYVCEITLGKLVYEELFAQIVNDDKSYYTLVSFRLNGGTTDQATYTEAYEQFKQTNHTLTGTTMVTVEWNASDPEDVAKMLLTSGQQFLYNGK